MALTHDTHDFQEIPTLESEIFLWNSRYDPSRSLLHPIGTNLQYYQPGYPNTVGMAETVTRVSDLQKQVVKSDVSHTRDIIQLQRQTSTNSEDIKYTQAITARDMRTLQGMILDLQAKVEHGQVAGPSFSLFPSHRADQDLAPPSELLENFDKDTIADEYIIEAEDAEKLAAKLRAQAATLRGGSEINQHFTTKLLEAPKNGADKEAMPNYACCGTSLTSIKALIEHVYAAHGQLESFFIKVPNDVGSKEPQRASPQRGRAGTRSHALEIKAPGGQALADKVTGTIEGNIPAQDNHLTEEKSVREFWQPVAVRNMPPVKDNIPSDHTETFTWEFIKLLLRGEQWSPGYYFITHEPMLPSKAYWILEAEYEPFLPKEPGKHGAKLTAFFNGTLGSENEAPEEENYIDTPVFIRSPGEKEYRYFGNYSQTRFSDKLDCDCIMDHIPDTVRHYWAEQLAEAGRPQWVTDALIEHFWPKPSYNGPIPTESAVNTPATVESTPTDHTSGGLEKRVIKGLKDYAEGLKFWKKDAELKVKMLTPEALMKAFENPDAEGDERRGLRLWWEYLQCTKYDAGFYDMLVKVKMRQSSGSGKSSTRAGAMAGNQQGNGKNATTSVKADSNKPIEKWTQDESAAYQLKGDNTSGKTQPPHLRGK